MSSKLARLQARIAELEAGNAELRADLNLVTEGRWTQTEIDACMWRGHQMALRLQSYDSAVGGAPGVSETHTDPATPAKSKETQ